MKISDIKVPELTVAPSTLGNELQLKILKSMRLNNFLMAYICLFATLRLLAMGN